MKTFAILFALSFFLFSCRKDIVGCDPNKVVTCIYKSYAYTVCPNPNGDGSYILFELNPQIDTFTTDECDAVDFQNDVQRFYQNNLQTLSNGDPISNAQFEVETQYPPTCDCH